MLGEEHGLDPQEAEVPTVPLKVFTVQQPPAKPTTSADMLANSLQNNKLTPLDQLAETNSQPKQRPQGAKSRGNTENTMEGTHPEDGWKQTSWQLEAEEPGPKYRP